MICEVVSNHDGTMKRSINLNSSKIAPLLTECIDKSIYRSILVDGPWGCGKTHAILDFVKNNDCKHKKYYLSLFGPESIDEINTELYYQVHDNLKLVKKLYNSTLTVSKAIKPFTKLPIDKSLECILNLAPNKKIRDKVIILDDLERTSKNVDYLSLMGYINGLISSGCQIICLTSSDNIPNERNDEYELFKEKVFDRIILINDSNEEIIRNIFSQRGFENIDEILPLFELNIRTAERVAYLYEDINQYLMVNSRNLDECVIDKLSILKACVYCIKLSLGKFDKPIMNEKDAFARKWKYKTYSEEFNENIASGLLKFEDSKEFINKNILGTVLAVMNFSLNGNTSQLDDLFYKEIEPKDIDIMEKPYFYLSDQGKEKFIIRFKEQINSGSFDYNKDTFKIIIQILGNSDYKFTKEEVGIIAQKCFEAEPFSSKREGMFWYVDQSEKNKTRFKSFEDAVMEIVYSKQFEWHTKMSGELTKNKRYDSLPEHLELIDRYDDSVKEKLICEFVRNEFYFPDMQGELSKTSWHAAHALARKAKELGKTKEFIDYARKKCDGVDEKSSMFDRYNTLLEQYCGDSINGRMEEKCDSTQ